MPEQRVVKGTVRPPDGMERRGIKVAVLDRDLPSRERHSPAGPEVLGEATADAEGRFEIGYALEQFGVGDAGPVTTGPRKADLSFHLFGPDGAPLAVRSIRTLEREFRGDEIIFNAPASIQIEIIIDRVGEQGVSEYERLHALLAPVLDGLSLDDLADEDISFLWNEFGLERQAETRQHVDWLRWSAALARQAQLPAPAFYGWARTDLPADLWARLDGYDDEQRRGERVGRLLGQLAAAGEEALAAHLARAAETLIIPAGFRGRAKAVAAAMARRSRNRMVLRLRLEAELTREPLAGYTVTTLDAEDDNRDLGVDLTDAVGEFEVAVHVAAAARNPACHLRFRIRGPEMADPVEVEKRVPAREDLVVTLSVALQTGAPNLQQLRADGHLQVPNDVVGLLEQRHGIRTLADIRRRGGLMRIEALRALDPTVVRRLDALADLERLSADPNEMVLLIHHGFHSVAAIADTPRDEFFATLAADRAAGGSQAAISARRAAELHVMAQAQTNLFKQLFVGLAADAASGIRPDSDIAAGEYFPPFPPESDHG